MNSEELFTQEDQETMDNQEENVSETTDEVEEVIEEVVEELKSVEAVVEKKPFYQRGSIDKTMYIGNLPWKITHDELISFINQFATVVDARIIKDKFTGRSRGFGFVEIKEDVDPIIVALEGKELEGRALTVNKAKPRAPKPQE